MMLAIFKNSMNNGGNELESTRFMLFNTFLYGETYE